MEFISIESSQGSTKAAKSLKTYRNAPSRLLVRPASLFVDSRLLSGRSQSSFEIVVVHVDAGSNLKDHPPRIDQCINKGLLVSVLLHSFLD